MHPTFYKWRVHLRDRKPKGPIADSAALPSAPPRDRKRLVLQLLLMTVLTLTLAVGGFYLFGTFSAASIPAL